MLGKYFSKHLGDAAALDSATADLQARKDVLLDLYKARQAALDARAEALDEYILYWRLKFENAKSVVAQDLYASGFGDAIFILLSGAFDIIMANIPMRAIDGSLIPTGNSVNGGYGWGMNAGGPNNVSELSPSEYFFDIPLMGPEYNDKRSFYDKTKDGTASRWDYLASYNQYLAGFGTVPGHLELPYTVDGLKYIVSGNIPGGALSDDVITAITTELMNSLNIYLVPVILEGKDLYKNICDLTNKMLAAYDAVAAGENDFASYYASVTAQAINVEPVENVISDLQKLSQGTSPIDGTVFATPVVTAPAINAAPQTSSKLPWLIAAAVGAVVLGGKK